MSAFFVVVFMKFRQGMYRSTLLLLLIIVCFVFSYVPAIDAPFYLDDQNSIVENTHIQSVNISELTQFFPGREVGYFSFAINKLLSGLDVISLRITNIAIHLIVAISLYWFARIVMAQLRANDLVARRVALVAGSLFLLSALNSQPVIYVVQRLTLLSALFFMLTLVCYIYFRTKPNPGKFIWLLFTCVFFYLGIHTKQNFFVLPLAVLVIEWCWLSPNGAPKFLKPLGVVVVAAGVGLHFFDFYFQLGVLDMVDAASRETYRLTRWQYFTHQLSAIFMYQWKFIIPYPLLLEYSSTPTTWANWITWLALCFHIGVIGAAIKYKSKQPLIAALILIYYVAHLIESSINPISDLTVEHRAYLPNLFLAFALAVIWNRIFDSKRRLAIALLVVMLTTNIFALQARSKEWADKETFYRKELKYTGDNSRIYAEISNLFVEQNRLRVAQRWMKHAITIGLETKHLQGTTVVKYIQLLVANNKIALANRYAVLGLGVITLPQDRAIIYYEIAKLKASQGLCDASNSFVENARKLNVNTYEFIECQPLLIKYAN